MRIIKDDEYMDITDYIINSATIFYNDLKNGRYCSWEHCYSIFCKSRGVEKQI